MGESYDEQEDCEDKGDHLLDVALRVLVLRSNCDLPDLHLVHICNVPFPGIQEYSRRFYPQCIVRIRDRDTHRDPRHALLRHERMVPVDHDDGVDQDAPKIQIDVLRHCQDLWVR